jgi:hypothetical protein
LICSPWKNFCFSAGASNKHLQDIARDQVDRNDVSRRVKGLDVQDNWERNLARLESVET